MSAPAGGGRTDTASRVIRALPHVIYRALLNPEALVAWLPPTGMRGAIDVFEAREDGAYRMTLTYEQPGQSQGKTSEDADVVHGRFVKLVPDKCVVQQVDFDSHDPAFAGTMTMTWTMDAVPEGTKVTVVCEDVPRGVRKKDHDAGLNSSLQNLARYVE